ncbi:hypothetical protein M0D21_21320 [Aquimarina sp. D1M17]|uniref:hypothetical protein n=1 Tax=Aquimarina acroporae TaxID=2937283 RepID=UPI0020BFC495|nr:hypothetical protein [Aquimarina acroporae]MCK8524132.1 hypothetical protein [Aquimarina acroporae]
MKFLPILSLFIFLISTPTFGQKLNEKDWMKLSDYISAGNQDSFKKFLNDHNFSKVDEPNQKYTFYQWKQSEPHFYGVRVNKTSGQVTYMTNDQNYVLKLISKFIADYALVKSETKGTTSTTHVFQSPNSTIAVKLDSSGESGTHLLFAISNQ